MASAKSQLHSHGQEFDSYQLQLRVLKAAM